MANLSRKTAKIFGETATTTGNDPEIGQFGSAKAGTYVGTNDIDTIQALPAWSNGWVDAVTPTQQFPPLPEMTGVHKVLSYQNAYLLQKGIAEWDAGTTYYIGDLAKGFGEGKIYVSKVDGNINHELSDSDYWDEFSRGANIELGNLNNIGNSKFQNAPFSINNGTITNGENATLYLPDGSQTIIEIGWQQPILSANGTMGGSSFAVSASSEYSTWKAWQAFNGETTGNEGWESTSTTDAWIQFYNPTALKVSQLDLLNFYRDIAAFKFESGSVEASNDGTSWTELCTFTANQTAGGTTTVNVNSSNFYKYHRINCHRASSGYIIIQEITITAVYQETIDASTSLICDLCTITTADSKSKTYSNVAVLDISNLSLSDNTYNVCKSFADGSLSLVTNITVSKTEPQSPTSDDCWLDISKRPLSFKKYNGSAWVDNNDKVFIGSITVASDIITKVENVEINRFSEYKYTYPIASNMNNGAWYKITQEYDLTTGQPKLWAECGAVVYQGTSISGDNNISFPFVAANYEFVDTNYTFVATAMHSSANLNTYGIYERQTSRTVTSTVLRSASALFGYEYRACGYVKLTQGA